jgi:hypothetical protein
MQTNMDMDINMDTDTKIDTEIQRFVGRISDTVKKLYPTPT